MSGTIGCKHFNFSLLTSIIYIKALSKKICDKQGKGLKIFGLKAKSTNEEFIACRLPNLQCSIWVIRTKAPSKNFPFTKRRRETQWFLIFLG